MHLPDLLCVRQTGNIACSNCQTGCVFERYIAPEVLLHVGHNYTADYFSLGVVTFEILTCRSPFRHHDVIDTHRATLRGITGEPVLRKQSVSYWNVMLQRGFFLRQQTL